MKKPLTQVSDHALVCYLERVLLVDVGRLRNRIGRLADNAVKEGASAVTIGGVRYLLRGDVMTTVVPVKKRPRRGSRKQK